MRGIQNIIPHDDDLLKKIDNVDVREMIVDHLKQAAYFRFTFSPDELDTVATFSQVAYCRVSSDPEQDELPFVGKLDIYRVEDGGQRVLEMLGYCLQDREGAVRTSTTLQFYIHIEGEICVDLVCGSYWVRQVPFGSPLRLN